PRRPHARRPRRVRRAQRQAGGRHQRGAAGRPAGRPLARAAAAVLGERRAMIRYFGVLLALALLGLLVPLLVSDKGRRSVVLALRSLWLHKLRSFLSVLGIVIGTGAVIALWAVGEGTMHDALEDIKRQGATNIMIRSVRPAEES